MCVDQYTLLIYKLIVPLFQKFPLLMCLMCILTIVGGMKYVQPKSTESPMHTHIVHRPASSKPVNVKKKKKRKLKLSNMSERIGVN